MIKAIAIDDEPIALKIIEEHASKIPFLQMEGYFSDAIEALEFVEKSSLDLIFLDINMPDISGIDFLKATQNHFQVIFTTAYSDYAIESYEHNATDYLLKPFEFGRFLKATMKVRERLANKPLNFMFVKSGYEYVKIHFDQLLYVKGEGNYLKLVEKNKSTLSRMTFEELIRQLPNEFLSVHRSYIINSLFIEKLEKHQVGIGSFTIPVNTEGFEKLKSLVQ